MSFCNYEAFHHGKGFPREFLQLLLTNFMEARSLLISYQLKLARIILATAFEAFHVERVLCMNLGSYH